MSEPSPKRRRWPWFVLVLFLAGSVAWWLWTREPAAVEGTLVPSAVEANEYEAGPFRLVWAPNPGVLSIEHQDQPGQAIWASVPGQSFINAGLGRAEVTEERALFDVKDERLSVLDRQSVDTIIEAGGSVIIGGQLTGGGRQSNYLMRFRAESDQTLRFAVSLADSALNRVYLTASSGAEERFFGFGEQFSHFDLKGKRVPILVGEQGIGRGAQPITLGADLTAGAGGSWHTTYAAIPHYVTSQLRSLSLEATAYSIFDLRDDDKVSVEVFAPEVVGRIYYGETPLDLVKAHTEWAGRMRRLPDWILEGAVIGLQGGTGRVRTLVESLRAGGVEIAGLWLQDWVGRRTTSFGEQLWWNWTLDRAHYPEWEALVADMDSAGIETMSYVNPFLVDVSERAGTQRNLFQEARTAGFLVETEAGEPYLIQNTDFSAGLIDLTNPDGRAWMLRVLNEEVIARGVRGWMADFGEALPADAVLADGSDAFTWHNQYPVWWAQVNQDAVDALGDSLAGEFVFFMRSGYTTSPRYTSLFWLGDQMVSWDEHDGLKTAVTGLLSSGLSGYAFNHSDVGGYTAITHPIRDYHRSRELYMRWAELSAFNVVFRTHEGNKPDMNHQAYTDAETIAHTARMVAVYNGWKGYRRQLVDEAARTGAPVVRPLWMHYPDDPVTYTLNHEAFLVGYDLLVAPVTDPGRTTVRAYLPDSEWVHLWSGQTFTEPGWHTVDAPIGEPAVFFRAGSPAGREFAEMTLADL